MRSMLTALFILLALIGSTATAKPLPANLDARMFVNGTVTVSEAGRVLDHRIDTEVDAQIRELIDGESPVSVLSDDRIVDVLRVSGIEIARRTVAKYREAMRIPSSVDRKRIKQSIATAGSGNTP